MSRRMMVPLVLLALAIGLTAPIRSAGFEVEDHETVYGLLDPAGNPTDLTVVDWLRIYGNGETTVVDPGDLSDVRNVKGPERPNKVAGGLAWQVRCRDGLKDIFYSGHTKRTLPVDIKITYVLNGKEVPGTRVGGAKGDLAVKISLVNRLRAAEKISYAGPRGETLSSQEDFLVPLVANVTTDIPSARFRRIDAPEATTIATGATVKVSWIVFPYPTVNLTLHLVSDERIRLEPIYIALAPKLPPIPDIEIRGQLAELTQGAHQLDMVLGEVAGGADRLAQGQTQIVAGVGALQAGVADLCRLNEAHQEIVKRTTDGLTGLDLDGISTSLGRLGELTDGLGRLEDGLTALSQLNEGHQQIVSSIQRELDAFNFEPVKKGLDSLGELSRTTADADKYLGRASASYASQARVAKAARDRHDELCTLLEQLGNRNPALAGSAEYKDLKRLAELQRDSLGNLVNGGRESGKSYDGMSYTSKVLETLAKKVRDGKEGLAALEDLASKADGMLSAFERLQAALKVLAQGGVIQGQAVPGLDRSGKGLAEARDGVAVMRAGVNATGNQRGLLTKAQEGLALLRTALEVLLHGGVIEGQKVPGLDTAGQGLAEAGKGLDQLARGVAESKAGAGQLKEGVVQVRTQGVQRMYLEMAGALGELNKAEALKKVVASRVDAYDHFIGKPAGARGEVRFLLRTETLR